MTNPIDSIYDDLTAEEKLFLSKIETKLAASLEKIKDSKFDHLDDNDPNPVPDFSKRLKILDFETIFNIYRHFRIFLIEKLT